VAWETPLHSLKIEVFDGVGQLGVVMARTASGATQHLAEALAHTQRRAEGERRGAFVRVT